MSLFSTETAASNRFTVLQSIATLLGTTAAKVQGLVAAGSPSAANPVVVGGEDSGGDAQALPVDGDGATVKQPDASKLKVTEANSSSIKGNIVALAGALTAPGTALGAVKGVAALGSDGAKWRALLTKATGRLEVHLVDSGATTIDPSTEAKQDDIITALGSPAQAASQTKPALIEVNFSGASYAGAELTSTETLTASTWYTIVDAYATLSGGTGGNTTQPGFSGVSGFSQDTDDEAWQISTAMVDGTNDMQHDVLGLASPAIKSDGSGKVYMKGAAPGAADSTLTGKLILRECRAGA